MSSSPSPFDFSEFTAPAAVPQSVGFEPAASAPPAVPGGFDFGGDASAGLATSGTLEPAGPPVGWIFAAGGVSALGLGVAVALGTDITVAVIAWVLCGPVAIGLLGVFTMRDTAAQAEPLYTAPKWVTSAYWIALTLSMLGVVASALRIADWVGRL